MKNNLIASAVIFLVSLPLCQGIALASGVSLLSGIISGAIGGLVVGLFSDSKVSISGPTAGMIVVVLNAVHQLGSFEAFLLALCLAGFFQVLAGCLRLGFIANFVPIAVVKGLLVAMGILIIVKQLPIALGCYTDHETFKLVLKMAQENLSLVPLLHLSHEFSSEAIIITIISLIILFSWDKLPSKFFRHLSGALCAVIVAVIVRFFIQYYYPNLALPDPHLVHFPLHQDLYDVISHLSHPHFNLINEELKNPLIYYYGLIIAILGSLETLLNLEAIEKIDKRHRYCSRDQELIAQGMGNALAGLVGGLPITSVIDRSAGNINAGAHNKFAAILLGLWLLLSFTFFGSWLNFIPVQVLAAILINTGCRLARVSLFKEMYRAGWRYFLPFIVTIIAILATNIILGIIIGLMTSVLLILRINSRNCFTIVKEKHPAGNVLKLIFPQQVSFLNRAAIIDGLNKIPKGSNVILDATSTDYIDEDILETIRDFTSAASEKNISMNVEGLQKHYVIRPIKSFITATTRTVQASLTPETIFKILKEGNQRFVLGTPIHKNYKQQITATATSQHPIAVILSCIDSRVPVELILDLTLGDVFVVRIAGNIANEDILGSIEFACHIAGAKLIVVLGHKGCGAIKAACQDFSEGHISHIVDKIKPAIALEYAKSSTTCDTETFLLNVTQNNVMLTRQWLYQHSTILQNLIDSNRVGLVGGIYDVNTGQIEFDESQSLISSPSELPTTSTEK